MRPAVIICINGILNKPGKADGWTDRAVTWFHCKYPESTVRAEKFEYATGALLRRIKQARRAQAIARMCGFYRRAGYRIHLVGHSNGCDLIARVLEIFGYPVESVHLFAPAADGGDFLAAFEQGRLGELHIYGSRKDRALKLARLSRRLAGWIRIRGRRLGYGSLGLLGREFAHEHAPAWPIHDHSDDAQGHSTWFGREGASPAQVAERLELTFQKLAANLPENL